MDVLYLLPSALSATPPRQIITPTLQQKKRKKQKYIVLHKILPQINSNWPENAFFFFFSEAMKSKIIILIFVMGKYLSQNIFQMGVRTELPLSMTN